MKKHYGIIIAVFLILLWAGYIVFWDNAYKSVGTDETELAPTPVLTDVPATPTLEPTDVPEATDVPATPSPEPTDVPATPSPEPTDVPATPTPEPTDVPATPTPVPATPTPVPTPVAGTSSFNLVIANVSIHLNIRSGAGEEYDIIGMMEPDSWAEVIERGDEWTRIRSGGITGYAYNEYLFFGQAAINRARQLNALFVEVTAETMNIRTQSNTNCAIIREAVRGENFTYIPEQSTDEWIAIQYDADTVAYLAANLVRPYLALSTAIEAQ